MTNLDEIIDVIVKIEMFPHGHHPRILPIRDVDVVMRKKGFDRAAQQRGVMTRHGGDDQKLGLGRARREVAPKSQEPAKWLGPDNLFLDGDLLPVDRCAI